MSANNHEIDLYDILANIETGAATREQLMRDCLDKIEECNPEINAIISMRPRDELISEAKAADEKPAQKALHGIPFAIKDLVETEGIRTTHGSPIFADHIPVQDDLLAKRIKAAGAIIIGKTNTPEFGLGSQSYNPVHGTTRNPYDLSKTAGGSSGGAAAALALRMLPVADGSDMMGSLRNPAAFCNIYGFRPSYGLIPDDPAGETFIHQLSTNGPMARSVRDLALLLDVISGPERASPHSLPQQPSFLSYLSTKSQKYRIAWLEDLDHYLPIEPEIISLCAKALDVLEKQGHVVEPLKLDFDPAQIWLSWSRLRSFAISSGLREYYENPATREQLKPEAVFEIEAGRTLTPAEIAEASLIRSQWFAYLAELFRTWYVLALPSAQVFPFNADTHWPASIGEREMTTYHKWMEVVVPASLVGIPVLNIPVGFSRSGLPMGMQLIGARGQDHKILRLGQDYHNQTRWPQSRPPA